MDSCYQAERYVSCTQTRGNTLQVRIAFNSCLIFSTQPWEEAGTKMLQFSQESQHHTRKGKPSKNKQTNKLDFNQKSTSRSGPRRPRNKDTENRKGQRETTTRRQKIKRLKGKGRREKAETKVAPPKRRKNKKAAPPQQNHREFLPKKVKFFQKRK